MLLSKRSKKTKKRQSSINQILFQPLQTVDPSLYEVKSAPPIQISAPYEYDPTTQVPIVDRKPVNHSGSFSETYTGSKTVTTLIGTVAKKSILLNYCMTVAIVSGTIPDWQRFRLIIERGNDTLFTISIARGGTGSETVASNAEIVLQVGDKISIVSLPANVTNMLYYHFGSVMLQPYE